MYQLNYFRKRSSDGIGYQSQIVGVSRTGIGILYGMLCYLLDRSIKCYEVVNVLTNKLILSWSR